MFEDFAAFCASSIPPLNASSRFIDAYGLRGVARIDHICFKCSSIKEFEHLRSVIERDPPSAHLHQVFLAGRRVAYFGLRRGITVVGTEAVRYVELAEPKPSEGEQAGFHHVEVFPVGVSIEALLHRLEERGVRPRLKVRPHHTTHDLVLPSGLILRITQKPLIRTIAERELLA